MDKSNYIYFHVNSPKYNNNVELLDIKMNNQIIRRVSHTKFLGVLIDEKLTWNNHISDVTNKISKNVGVIRKLSNLLPQRILFTLYNTLILPYLWYYNVVWTNT